MGNPKDRFMYFKFLLAAIFLIFTYDTALAEKRVAFIVGNGAYAHATPLDNPVNDATAMSAKLKELGFLTVDGFDLNRTDFDTRIRDFAKLAKDADLALFFYAGHGIAVNGVNYLIPVDAQFEDETALDFEAIPVDFVAKLMRRSGGVNLLMLDACRNNPLASTLARSMGQSVRSTVSTGLAEMKLDNPGRGLAIAFATSPGEIALDGTGRHSPFTTALLDHIDAPNTDFTEVMGRVTGQVYEETQQTQRPWLNTSLTGPVILNAVETPVVVPAQGQTAQAPQTTASAASFEVEKTVYDMARESGRISDYQAYLETFPNGVFAAFARKEIQLLEQQQIDQQLTLLDTSEEDTGTTSENPVRSVATEPDVLAPSPEILSLPSNAATQDAMGMNWAMRREVQARINLAGYDVGRPDGVFGPKTRRGILAWQDGWGFAPTGYLNQQQYLFLVRETREDYTVWAINNPVVVRKSKPRNTNNNGLGAFLGGVATGIILSK